MVKNIEFISVRTEKGHRCNITVQNVHVQTEDISDDTKDSFHGELEHVFNQFPKHHV
jgi:hypothetical protein